MQIHELIDTIAVPLMLTFGAIALVAAIGGIIGFVIATGKNLKAAYLWRISGGISYLSLAVSGAVAVGYLSEGRTTTQILVVAFMLLGIWLLNTGLRLRAKVMSESRN